MAISINFKNGITLQELNKLITKGMKKYAEVTSKAAKEVAECSGKTSSEIAEMTSKKDIVALSKKNIAMETPFVEMNLRHNLAYTGLRGESANKVFADGSSMEIKQYYDLKTGKLVRKDKTIDFANGAKREIQEGFGEHAYKSVLSTNSRKNADLMYQNYTDKKGRTISCVKEIAHNQSGFNHATKGTIHINGTKVYFERVKNSAGEYTDAYKATVKTNGKTDTVVFDDYQQLAKHIDVPESTFWGL